MKTITRENLFKLLDVLKTSYDVYAPVRKGPQRFYQKYAGPDDSVVVGEVRAFEPLKAFFFRSREVVAEDFKADVPGTKRKPLAIVGVKACDLKGFKVQDHVFKGKDCQDPFYIRNREDNLIISADCTGAIDTCFCRALGVNPYPEGDFDLNFSSVEDFYLVDAGSEKGQRLMDDNASLFQETSPESIAKRDKIRQDVVAAVEKNLSDNQVPVQEKFKGIIEKNYESGIWEEEAATCVECGACNTICPTCHCFFLFDQKKDDQMTRTRLWDSCLLKNFARVAGGANPRPTLWMRLRNRFDKKFDYFPKVANIYACTGCGRCISACPAKIDIRRILKNLVANV